MRRHVVEVKVPDQAENRPAEQLRLLKGNHGFRLSIIDVVDGSPVIFLYVKIGFYIAVVGFVIAVAEGEIGNIPEMGFPLSFSIRTLVKLMDFLRVISCEFFRMESRSARVSALLRAFLSGISGSRGCTAD